MTRDTRPVFCSVFMIACSGCGSINRMVGVDGPTDARMVEEIRQTGISRAIVTQATVYPYHFRTGSAALNELGRHDLTVLADHYRDNPGMVNVRRGDVPRPLYDARVDAVLQMLSKLGVDAGAMTVADGFPGGDGISSEYVVRIIEDDRDPAAGRRTTPRTSSMRMSGGPQ